MTEESDLTCSTVRSWELESRIYEGVHAARWRHTGSLTDRESTRRAVDPLLDPSSWILAPGPLREKSLLGTAIHPNISESVRGYGSVTYKPRQGRNAATVVCSPLP